MKFITRHALLALSLCGAFAVAGCGGGSGSGSNGPTTPTIPTNSATDVPIGKIAYTEFLGSAQNNGAPTSGRGLILRRAGDAGRQILSQELSKFNINIFASAISPDGTRVAFLSSVGLYTVNADGSQLKPLDPQIPSDASTNVSPLQWAPDGRRVLLLANRIGTDAVVYSLDVDEKSVLSPPFSISLNENVTDFALSPDGRTLAYVAFDSAARRYFISLLSLSESGAAQGQPRRLNLGESNGNSISTSVAFSPDGSRLAISSSRIGSDGVTPIGALSIVNLDGTNARALPIGDDLASDPAWSPDGAYLAYAGAKFRGLKAPSNSAAYEKIRVIRTDGASGPRDLGIAGSTGDQSAPSWGR